MHYSLFTYYPLFITLFTKVLYISNQDDCISWHPWIRIRIWRETRSVRSCVQVLHPLAFEAHPPPERTSSFSSSLLVLRANSLSLHLLIFPPPLLPLLPNSPTLPLFDSLTLLLSHSEDANSSLYPSPPFTRLTSYLLLSTMTHPIRLTQGTSRVAAYSGSLSYPGPLGI